MSACPCPIKIFHGLAGGMKESNPVSGQRPVFGPVILVIKRVYSTHRLLSFPLFFDVRQESMFGPVREARDGPVARGDCRVEHLGIARHLLVAEPEIVVARLDCCRDEKVVDNVLPLLGLEFRRDEVEGELMSEHAAGCGITSR